MERVTSLPANHIFVFGSNEAGIHGAGAALDAKRNFGAIQGKGLGFYGQSFAIPTKDYSIQTLGLREISTNIWNFLHFAEHNSQYTFHMTPIGTGLAGVPIATICDMFIVWKQQGPPKNIIWPQEFIDYWDSIGYQGYRNSTMWQKIIKRLGIRL